VYLVKNRKIQPFIALKLSNAVNSEEKWHFCKDRPHIYVDLRLSGEKKITLTSLPYSFLYSIYQRSAE